MAPSTSSFGQLPSKMRWGRPLPFGLTSGRREMSPRSESGSIEKKRQKRRKHSEQESKTRTRIVFLLVLAG
jgi:hypothetical protein